jgi:hypothetical protein
MGKIYEMMRKKGIEICEDLAKWPEIHRASSVVQRLKDATEAAHRKRRNIISKFSKHL